MLDFYVVFLWRLHWLALCILPACGTSVSSITPPAANDAGTIPASDGSTDGGGGATDARRLPYSSLNSSAKVNATSTYA